ncbi:MAG: hypothetical protein CVU47_00215 [Chloroflexi bacterium HGW-Chloroflexi-9]|nr:MAG: hypothetical protein CVU47_00215 [Chloroflexi bacterium HGW-Chloroflexi-9]
MRERPDMLDQWGRYAVRRRWPVIATWVVIAALLAVTARSISQGTVSSLTIPGAESQDAVEVLQRSFPQRAGDYMDVVFAAPGGIDQPDTQARIDGLIQRASEVPGVIGVASPYELGGIVSADRTVAIARVLFALPADDVPAETAEAISTLAASANSAALTVELGGPVALAQEREGPNESTVLGLIAAVVVLLVLFRALVPSVLPIVSSMAGLATGFAVIFAMTAVIDLSKFAPNIAAMLGLGVGIDYALFIVARYRENVLAGHTTEEAVGIAMATAGKSVAFAGSVVITSLLGLGLMGIPFVAWLGVSASAMVAVTMLTALTLLPALLGVVGVRIVTRRQRPTPASAQATHVQHETSLWFHLGHAIMRRPYVFFVVSAVILLGLSVPVLDMRLGSADAGNNPTSTTTRRAYDLVAGAFGPGMNGPLQVVIEGATPEELEQARLAMLGTAGVQSVSQPLVNPAGTTVVLSVVPTTSPQAAATADLVHVMRDEVLPGALGDGGATAYVGGATARAIDIADRIGNRLPLFFSLVIGISFVLLVLVFRSLAIPLKAALMNLLSIGAAYGVVVAVFQWGWGMELVGVTQAGPIESFLPMMLFAVLFGLSMDYEVFLVSRIREEYLASHDNAASVARGLAATASVITAAAAIMIVVFLSFVLNDQRVVKEFGLGLAVAVFVDATIVRLLLVPATLALMGDWNWWLPAWLDRLLPRISIEDTTRHPLPAAPSES